MRMFRAMDTDQDGLVSATEFESFFLRTGIPLGRERVKELFRIIQPTAESQLKYEDFVRYFKNEQSPPQFDVPDETLSSIKTIEEYIAVANAAGTTVCVETLEIIAGGLRQQDLTETMRKLLEEGSALQESLSDPGEKRWRPFSGFQRRVEGQTVMSAPVGIVRDLLPGDYEASDLAQHSQLRHLLEPRMTVVEDVQWVEGQWREEGGQKKWTEHSRIVFPASFDGVIETDVSVRDIKIFLNVF